MGAVRVCGQARAVAIAGRVQNAVGGQAGKRFAGLDIVRQPPPPPPSTHLRSLKQAGSGSCHTNNSRAKERKSLYSFSYIHFHLFCYSYSPLVRKDHTTASHAMPVAAPGQEGLLCLCAALLFRPMSCTWHPFFPAPLLPSLPTATFSLFLPPTLLPSVSSSSFLSSVFPQYSPFEGGKG